MLGGPTIAEVARRAGVSPATVSRVLNGTARVSQECAPPSSTPWWSTP
ncbi:hypothetical protein CSW23_03505 [Thermus scotoductus]|uniref:Uncharacterized protein n=1 Tax=Thermus scotoductus TaxID=37636 RepID=A0A430V5L3_THESC|nr:hypothetical protein CSW31_03135 [Thermus scotoductus]RTI19248.1 hypothetical protein CSW23_03505 [Thermus scotoductus]